MLVVNGGSRLEPGMVSWSCQYKLLIASAAAISSTLASEMRGLELKVSMLCWTIMRRTVAIGSLELSPARLEQFAYRDQCLPYALGFLPWPPSPFGDYFRI